MLLNRRQSRDWLRRECGDLLGDQPNRSWFGIAPLESFFQLFVASYLQVQWYSMRSGVVDPGDSSTQNFTGLFGGQGIGLQEAEAANAFLFHAFEVWLNRTGRADFEAISNMRAEMAIGYGTRSAGAIQKMPLHRVFSENRKNTDVTANIFLLKLSSSPNLDLRYESPQTMGSIYPETSPPISF